LFEQEQRGLVCQRWGIGFMGDSTRRKYKFQSLILASLGLLGSAFVSSYAENQQIAFQEPLLLKGSIQQIRQADQEQNPDQLVIDNQFRVIGGAEDRSNSVQKQLPAQKFPFFVAANNVRQQATLTIGSIRGLNTPEAHQSGQSQADFVSSPAVIKVNGVRVGYIYTDGEAVTMQVPRRVLRPDGFNVLQIEAGFYFLAGNRIAYDELELQHLALNF
jgi:hypothetical protein